MHHMFIWGPSLRFCGKSASDLGAGLRAGAGGVVTSLGQGPWGGAVGLWCCGRVGIPRARESPAQPYLSWRWSGVCRQGWWRFPECVWTLGSTPCPPVLPWCLVPAMFGSDFREKPGSLSLRGSVAALGRALRSTDREVLRHFSGEHIGQMSAGLASLSIL